MGTSDRLKKELESALVHAEKKKEQLHQDIDELRREAERGKDYRKKVVLAAVIAGGLVAGALIFVMFREPQYRSLFGFFLVCLLLMGALHFFRGNR